MLGSASWQTGSCRSFKIVMLMMMLMIMMLMMMKMMMMKMMMMMMMKMMLLVIEKHFVMLGSTGRRRGSCRFFSIFCVGHLDPAK